jgi:hypothetical protein
MPSNPTDHTPLLVFLEEERRKALSPREWKHRIAGYGYAIKNTARGVFVASLARGSEICPLPAHLAI